jgi:hypothetical protein
LKVAQKLLRPLVGGINAQHFVERPLVFDLIGGDGRQPQPRDFVIRFGLDKLQKHLAGFDPLTGLGQLDGLMKQRC